MSGAPYDAERLAAHMATLEAAYERALEDLERQEERLFKRRQKVDAMRPRWRKVLIDPLVEALQTEFPAYRWRATGPLGLASRMHLVGEVPVPGDEEDHEEEHAEYRASFVVEPDASRHRLRWVNMAVDLGLYGPGTVGAANGLNHPVEEFPAWPELVRRVRAMLEGEETETTDVTTETTEAGR